MAQTAPLVADNHTFDLAVAEIPLERLVATAPVEANKSGIVLCNERSKVRAMVNGKAITYTVALYIQREALTDDEAADVTRIAKERTEAADKRKADEDNKREREIKRAVELTESAVAKGFTSAMGMVQGDSVRDAARRILGQ